MLKTYTCTAQQYARVYARVNIYMSTTTILRITLDITIYSNGN
jgi:hypothetical protein